MAKFKVGDRVYYRDDVNDTGTIVEPAGSDRYWVMWDGSQVRLSAFERNLNLIEEKKVKFEIGDRVKLDYSDYSGTIIGYQDGLWRMKWDDGTEWKFDDALGTVRKTNENVKMKFKVDDRVRFRQSNCTGVICSLGDNDGTYLIHWDSGYSDWINEKDLELVQQADVQITANRSIHSKDTNDTYTVAEFKKLLDKMDDDLILKMTDLRILFNRVPK